MRAGRLFSRGLFALLLSFFCLPRAGAALYAAAGKVDITPDPRRGWVWMAGYGPMGRPAKGVHDPLYARAVVVSDGRKTAALVSVDSIGIFREDVERVRRMLGWDGKRAYLFLAATHDHSAPDTMGLWGPFPGVSGFRERDRRRLLEGVAGLVRGLAAHTRRVTMDAAGAALDPNGLCRDTRDPVVIDPELQAVRLKAGGETVATIVRWSCHATALDWSNRLLTAEYPGFLCGEVEKREGGTCVFFNGAIGGHLVADVDESKKGSERYGEARRIGETVADAAVRALDGTKDRGLDGSVRFDSLVVRMPVENSRYIVLLPDLTAGHRLLDEQGRPLEGWKAWWLPLRHLVLFPLPRALTPWIETEVALVRIGPVRVLGVPGELFPELAIGGYGGEYRFGHPLVRPDNPAPPDLSRAPRGPHLRERLGARHALIVGLANDELGYFVPDYDFKAAATRTMLPQSRGDHYEETESLGPSATGILLSAYDELLKK